MLRARVPPEEMPDSGVLRAHRNQEAVERAFRHLTSVDFGPESISVRDLGRGRAHGLVCLLSYYLEWHLRRQLAPLLREGEDGATADRERKTPIAPAQSMSNSEAKRPAAQTTAERTDWDFRSLLGELGTLPRHRVRFQLQGGSEQPEVLLLTEPNDLQRRAFHLLQMRPRTTGGVR